MDFALLSISIISFVFIYFVTVFGFTDLWSSVWLYEALGNLKPYPSLWL